VCGGAQALGRCAALLAVWVGTTLQLHRLPGIKRFCFFSKEKRSRPFLVTFSGEPEKVTARREGAFAVSRRTAKYQFQTPHPAPN
jgi:hypothetical protein